MTWASSTSSLARASVLMGMNARMWWKRGRRTLLNLFHAARGYLLLQSTCIFILWQLEIKLCQFPRTGHNGVRFCGEIYGVTVHVGWCSMMSTLWCYCACWLVFYDADGPMIQCCNCEKWEHQACRGFLKAPEVDHKCHGCSLVLECDGEKARLLLLMGTSQTTCYSSRLSGPSSSSMRTPRSSRSSYIQPCTEVTRTIQVINPRRHVKG